MPLEIYRRGVVFWVRGRVEFDGRPITGYYRQSTGASDEAGARAWIAAETDQQRRRHLLGDEAALTFADAVLLYSETHTSPYIARQLLPITAEIGNMVLGSITGKLLKELGPKLKPDAAVDTWWRDIVTPARAVINHSHEIKGTPMIRVKRYDQFERIAQDQKRGKQSRVERVPSDKAWIEAFCAAADPYNAALARFMFETAARVGQAVALEPRHLDLKNRRVWLKAQKGHSAGWVEISHEMMVELANLPPKRPVNLRTGEVKAARIFGYSDPSSYGKRWRTICKDAGIPFISAHPAGRHGFYTELTVRQGVDPVTAAKAGRWADATLPMRTYAHAELDEAAIRARFRTKPVQGRGGKVVNISKDKE